MTDKESPSVQANFSTRFGGEVMWYQQAEDWANKQKFPVNQIALGIIAWLKNLWVDAKVEATMQDVDRQAEAIVEQWEKEDERPQPEIVETGVFGEEGWSISMSNPVVDRGTQEPESSMGTSSNEVRLSEKLPDPWDDK